MPRGREIHDGHVVNRGYIAGPKVAQSGTKRACAASGRHRMAVSEARKVGQDGRDGKERKHTKVALRLSCRDVGAKGR